MGGQQRRIAALADGLGDRFRHRIFALDGDLSALGLIKASHRVEARPLVIAKSRGIKLSNLRALRRAIAGADLLCTYNWGSLEAAIANKLPPRLPHVHYEDGFGPDEAGGKQIPRRVAMRRIILGRTIVATPSSTLQAIAINSWRLKEGRVIQLPLGVDTKSFACDRDYDRAPPLIGSVGSLRPEKNYARLIRLCATLKGESCLEIVGDGPERSALHALAGQGVTLSGPTTRTDLALRRFDIFALSSDTEQAPISLMEAMASGLPVAAPAVGDIAAMVSEPNRPFIAPAGDERALQQALQALIDDPDLRRTLGRANAAAAVEKFGAEAMISANLNLFERAMAERS
jgi:glycosyltransferase involved in cell wall biosynthesis